MKKLLKTLSLLIVMTAVIPAGAGYGIMIIWNWIMPAILGCADISFWQGVGLFLLGQLLSAGFILCAFMLGGALHVAAHHRHGRWHDMTDDERRDFFERRRRWFEMVHSSGKYSSDD
ncbi:MAG: hypothetical protein NC405_08820 [Odoribacter sp.]|nr:hypothetical protein [Odoribacter sp.]